MNLRILLILLLATCNGCALLGNDPYVPEVKPVEVVTITKPAAVYHPPLPNKVNTKPVEWTVLTPTIMSEYLTDLEKGEAPTNVYYGISPTGYENLSVNMAELKRYIRQVLSIVDYYKKLDTQEDDNGSKEEEE